MVGTSDSHHPMDAKESHSKMPEALAEVPAQPTRYYSNGFFESHAANLEFQVHFHTHHTIKVIPDTAFEFNVICNNTGYKTRGALI